MYSIYIYIYPDWLWLAPYISHWGHITDKYMWLIFVNDVASLTNIRGRVDGYGSSIFIGLTEEYKRESFRSCVLRFKAVVPPTLHFFNSHSHHATLTTTSWSRRLEPLNAQCSDRRSPARPIVTPKPPSPGRSPSPTNRSVRPALTSKPLRAPPPNVPCLDTSGRSVVRCRWPLPDVMLPAGENKNNSNVFKERWKSEL
jgi:hypothetical protein